MIETQDQRIVGHLVYWTAGECHYDTLREGLDKLGFAHLLPPPRSVHTAVEAALSKLFLRRGSNVLVRPLEGRNGYEVVLEHRGRRQNQYMSLVTCPVFHERDAGGEKTSTEVTVTGVGYKHLKIKRRIPGIRTRSRQVDGATIMKAIRAEEELIGRHKCSRTLARIVGALWGTPLRDKGSVYWLPPNRLAKFEAVVQAFEEAAGERFGVHVMRIQFDAGAVKAVSESLENEIAKEVDRLKQGLTDPKHLPKAEVIAGRKDAAVNLRKRLTEYESLLGQPLEQIKRRIKEVERVLLVAGLARTRVGGPATT